MAMRPIIVYRVTETPEVEYDEELEDAFRDFVEGLDEETIDRLFGPGATETVIIP